VKPFKVVMWTLSVLVLAVAVVAGLVVLWSGYQKVPLPIEDRCEATAGGRLTSVTPDQAYNAAIISGMAIKRGLKPRAASIALTTAYQESGIRNLNYGHADSIGLFQQRPSKGWGTIEQIMDPWYSTRSFYRVMERIKNWETKDINNVAQAVQRSAYPDAYRKHVDRARTLASSLTGESPASFSCVINAPAAPNAEGMKTYLTKTLGDKVSIATTDTGLKVSATKASDAWAVAQLAIAATANYGLVSVSIGTASWTHSTTSLATWVGNPTEATEVALSFSKATPR
jgi:hypothetical protein